MKYVLAVIGLSLLPAFSYAGETMSSSSVRGGGKGIVCRNPDGGVRSVELLDLWEARELYGRVIQNSSAPVADQVNEALERLKYSEVATYDDANLNGIWRDLMADFTKEIATRLLTPEGDEWGKIRRLRGVVIAPTDDSFEEAWPADCGIEQIVAYNGWDRGSIVYINQDLYDGMDATNQAALIVHEAFYSFRAKGMEVKSSVRSRRTVGYLFSGGDFARQPDPSLPHVTCKAKDENVLASLTLFTDSAEGPIQGAVFNGYDENVVGFFPSPARVFDIPGQKKTLRSLFSYRKNCVDVSHFGRTWPLAILGGAGPADFDRSGTLVGFCRRGKLETYWSQEAFGNDDLSRLTPVTCKASNL